MAKRKVFYSFHFDNDVMRVQQIRNIGSIEENKPVTPQRWEEVKSNGNAAIERWIDDNMKDKSCVVVLVGEKTAERQWVQHEILKAYREGKGLLGIFIHNIKCPRNGTSIQGKKPFDEFCLKEDREKISKYIKCYNPTLPNAYSYIKKNLESWIEKAIKDISKRR